MPTSTASNSSNTGNTNTGKTDTGKTDTGKSNTGKTNTGKTTPPKSTGNPLPKVPDVSKEAAPTTLRLPAVASNTKASEPDDGRSRLGGPDDPAEDRDSRRSRMAKKSDDADKDDGPVRQQGRRGLGRRGMGVLLPPPGTFRPNEVLAINLNANGLARALKHNFRLVETTELPTLGLTVTRLETPEVQNAVAGRTTLHELLPDEGFEFNHIYTAGPLTLLPPPTAPLAPEAAPASTYEPAPASPAQPVPAGTDAPTTKTAVVTARAGAAVPGIARHGFGCATDRCFGISAINWQPQLATCAQGARIGVIDTGVDKSHPTFAGVTLEHRDFTPRNAKKPSNQHGTGIFSLLAGNPKSSTPGLVPDATFMVGDAFFADARGNAVSDTLTMLKALNWLKASRVDVANLSFAGPQDELVHDAIRELAKTGAVIVAAAGNEGPDAPPSYPAAYPEVIAVTAVDRKLTPYVYANRGNHIDVAAPGVDVWTALPNRREGPQTGTSFAVPFVTSVVALLYRADERTARADPLDPKERALALLQSSIKALGGPARRNIFGAGLVQAPAHCEPRGTAAVVSARVETTNGWTGAVKAVPTAAAIHPQGGSWASTVRRYMD